MSFLHDCIMLLIGGGIMFAFMDYAAARGRRALMRDADMWREAAERYRAQAVEAQAEVVKLTREIATRKVQE